MNMLLGNGNNLIDYLLLLAVYFLLFVVIKNISRRVELNFRRSFWILFWFWSISVFAGNYLFYLLGIMSFLPWLNNFFHTFIWIGLCLGFLFSGVREVSLAEQFILFSVFSFIVKAAEHYLLGTWELNHFFFIEGNEAYIIGWSLLDGLYPVISKIILKVFSVFADGVIVPKPELI